MSGKIGDVNRRMVVETASEIAGPGIGRLGTVALMSLDALLDNGRKDERGNRAA